MNRYLPPEWAPQSAVLLTWPHASSDWQPYLTHVEPVFIEIAREVACRERLIIACQDNAHSEHVKNLLLAHKVYLPKIDIYATDSNDTWARDHGPITVLESGQPKLLDFIFNGWGGKFNADLDNQITQRLHGALTFGRTPLETIDMVLEGGSIDVDGTGTLLTTTRCLLAPTRNPTMTKTQVEDTLCELLGVKRFLWLENGYLAGDDTDSHIDTLARFCDPHTLCYVACDDPSDEHYAELKAMEQELKAFRDANNNPYRLVPLPWPSAKYDSEGHRLPATYANFLIINGAVLVPTYEDSKDNEALASIRSCFPDREVIGIPCLPLIWQHGSLHCVTMQIAAPVKIV